MLDRFAAECKAVGMRISKSEAMVLSWKGADCPLWVREEMLPQVDEFKYVGVLGGGNGAGDLQAD